MHVMNEIKQIILTELKKGKTFNSFEDLLHLLGQKKDLTELESSWTLIKNWWNQLEEIIYLINSSQSDERIINSDGVILDKLGHEWCQKNIKIDSIDVEIIGQFLQSSYGQDLNFKTPFISFTGIFDKKEYRFTLQIIKKFPQMQIKIFIRVNRKNFYPIENYLIPLELLNILLKRNILISGATGSGKTTLLKSLLAAGGRSKNNTKNEHLLIIEDLNEIGEITNNTTQLCSSDLDIEMDTLLANALRMSPDRIILGEIRSKEVSTFTLALNSGHNGSMATVHANSAVETIYRMAELLQIFGNFGRNNFPQLMKIVSRNIDYVVYMKDKKVDEIIKVMGSSEKGAPYFEKVF